MVSRQGRDVLEGYFNGTSLGNDNDVSSALPTGQAMYVLAQNNNGTAAAFFDGVISIILVMNAVSDAEELAIYNIFHRYMTRIGL
jgi:hypothetical protein